MPPPDAARAHYAAQLRQSEAAAILASRQWQEMGQAGVNLDTSWSRIASRLVVVVASAQLGAARAGAAYVPAALNEIGQSVNPDAYLQPQAWAGVASDGRPLDSLLYSAVVHTKQALGQGVPLPEALASAGRSLDLLVRTQVADAARSSAGAAIAVRPQVGYTRVAGGACCQRCAVLVGKWFKWNTGFRRHPRCTCRHVPCEQSGFEGYTDKIAPDQVRDLNKDQRQAINDGANLNQVINSHRANTRANGGMTTSEGNTGRGSYGKPQRLTPEGIYRVSATREETLAKLKQYGYIL